VQKVHFFGYFDARQTPYYKCPNRHQICLSHERYRRAVPRHPRVTRHRRARARDARPPPTRARRAHDFPSTARDASRALERVDRSVKRENRRIPRDVPRNTREGVRDPSTVRARATRTASIE